MNEMTKEQLSAWIDDELSDEESLLLLHRIGRDTALRDELATSLKIGQAMRGEQSIAGDSFASRVALAIADEPTYDSGSGVVAVDSTPSSSGWFKAAAGAGIAAAVAAIVLVIAPGDTKAPVSSRDTFVAVPDAGSAAEDQRAGESDYVVPTNVSDSGLIAADPELAAYFLNHSRATGATLPANGRLRIIVGSDDAARATEGKDDQEQASGQ